MWPTLAQGYLAALLALMAAGQALSLPRFVRAMTAYAVSRPDRVARVLIVAEALAAVLLLPPVTRLAGAVLGLLVALAWTFFAARALAQRRRVNNCGCFGAFAAQRLRWHVLLQDAAFVALAAWAVAGAA